MQNRCQAHGIAHRHSLLCDTGQEGMSKVLDQILGVCFPQGKPRIESLLEKDSKASLLDKVLAERAIWHCALSHR